MVFRNLCERLRIRQGENLLTRESRSGYDNLSEEVRDEILSRTAHVWAKLEARRTFRPPRRTLGSPAPSPIEQLRARVGKMEAELDSLRSEVKEFERLRVGLKAVEQIPLVALGRSTVDRVLALRGRRTE